MIEIKKEDRLPLLIAIIHWIISFFTDLNIFKINIFNISAIEDIIKLILVKSVSLVIYVFLWKFLFSFFKRIKNKDKKAKDNLKIFLIYFLINFIILMLTWPGIWRWDEFNILNHVSYYKLEFWQHYLTSIMYLLSYMLIPIPSGVIIYQIAVASGIVAYIISNFKRIFNDSKWTYLLFIPFLLLPVLDHNMYPLRLTIYSYIELLLVCQLIFIKKLGKNSNKDFVVLSIILILLSAWRSEGILFIVLIPILYIFMFKDEIKELKTRIMYTIFTVTLAIMLIIPQQYEYKIKYSNKYDVTSYVNQLYVVTKLEFEENPDSVQLKTIGKVINFEELYKYSKGIEGHNSDKIYKKTATLEDYKNMKIAYRELLKKYPLDVLKERISVFLKTSGFVPDSNIHVENTRNIYTRRANYSLLFFRTIYDSTKPLNLELRNNVINFLECYDGEHTNFAFHIFYNVVPSMVIVTILIIVCLIKKNWALFFTFGVIIAKAFAIILTAPDCFFMYYLPIYQVGSFMLWLTIVQFIYNRRNVSSKVKILK